MPVVANFDRERTLVVDWPQLVHEQLNGRRELARIERDHKLLEQTQGGYWKPMNKR